MFSVNVDKLVKMTPTEANSYFQTADTIIKKLSEKNNTEESKNSKFSIGIIGDAVLAFKLAAKMTEFGKRVLFVDGDLNSEIFLGKYRLGKELEGLSDCIMSVITGDSFTKKICITNNKKLDILFSGNVGALGTTVSGVFLAGEHYIDSMLNNSLEKYDIIICFSDNEGNIAKYCDTTAIIVDSEEYNNEQLIKEQMVKLKDKGCDILGVIINE